MAAIKYFGMTYVLGAAFIGLGDINIMRAADSWTISRILLSQSSKASMRRRYAEKPYDRSSIGDLSLLMDESW